MYQAYNILANNNTHYSFGSLMDDRNGNSGDYRYGFSKQEKDDEIMGNGNSIDFGARMYDSRLGRFLSCDTYQKDYVPVSPYSYALDNPIIFKDKGGNWIEGLDGNPVTYTQNENGTITWSPNASEDVQRIGNAMLTTPTGKEAFDFWISYHKMVTIEVYSKRGRGKFALTTEFSENVLVQFFIGEIYDVKETNRFNIDPSNPTKSIDEDESVGAIGTHERWHLDPEQSKLDDEVYPEMDQNKMITKPINAEMKFREEYRQFKNATPFSPSQYNKYGFGGMDEFYNVKPVRPEVDSPMPREATPSAPEIGAIT